MTRRVAVPKVAIELRAGGHLWSVRQFHRGRSPRSCGPPGTLMRSGHARLEPPELHFDLRVTCRLKEGSSCLMCLLSPVPIRNQWRKGG